MSLNSILDNLDDALERLGDSGRKEGRDPCAAPPDSLPKKKELQPPEQRYSTQPSFWWSAEQDWIEPAERPGLCLTLSVKLPRYPGVFARFGRALYTPETPTRSLIVMTVTCCPLSDRVCGGRRDRCALRIEGEYKRAVWKAEAGHAEVPMN